MSRSQKDKDKTLQEKHQAILSQLLKDEDNKYCVDCDAKGPRWASWNLGIFLCIRCAGIHRNLGVHISRVKSVNLDTWTPEQMQMVQEMGNSRARAVYEANLPDDYRRPQTDSALENFIREKYEKKRYIAKEWIPPQPKLPANSSTEEKKEKKRAKPKVSTQIQLNSTASTSRPKSNTSSPSPMSVPKVKQPPVEKKPSASVDLLGLDTPSPAAATNNSSNSSDPFGDFLSAAPAAATSPQKPADTAPQPPTATEDNSLFGDTSEKPKSTKDSIMALYGSGTSQQQNMYGVPGTTNLAPSLNSSATNTSTTFAQYDSSTNNTMTNTQYGYYDPTCMASANASYGYYEAGSTNPPTSTSANYYDQGGMYMPQQQQAQYAMMQNGAMAQNNMIPNNMAMMQQQQQPCQQGLMMNQQQMGVGQGIPPGANNMQMMAGQVNMYNNQAQQQHLQQIQQQMASMKVNNPGGMPGMGMGMGMPQQPQAVPAGNMGWGGQQVGHTLSNNLWQ